MEEELDDEEEGEVEDIAQDANDSHEKENILKWKKILTKVKRS